MKKYPLIESLGLTLWSSNGVEWKLVDADELENILSEGVKVWGKDVAPNDEYNFNTNSRFHGYTHTALLINIKLREKPKPVSKEELIDFLKKGPWNFEQKRDELIERIESQGVE